MKRVILLFVALLEVFLVNNASLTATENPVAKSVDFSNAVETIEKEETPEIIEAEPVVAEIAAPKADIVEETYYEPVLSNYIDITGRTIEIEYVDSTAIDAGNHVNKYGKFLYGHNSYSVFGALDTLSEDDTFTVTLDGITRTYSIGQIVLYEKISSTMLREVKSGEDIAMFFVANAKTGAKSAAYDLSIMTCAGTSYGNGDASHRLVLFANEI